MKICPNSNNAAQKDNEMFQKVKLDTKQCLDIRSTIETCFLEKLSNFVHFTDQIWAFLVHFLIFNPFLSKNFAPITSYTPMIRFSINNGNWFTTQVTLSLNNTVHITKKTIICRPDRKMEKNLKICSNNNNPAQKDIETLQKLYLGGKQSSGISFAVTQAFCLILRILCILHTRYRVF